jgi:DNA-binding GntR family transcriptional regulator
MNDRSGDRNLLAQMTAPESADFAAEQIRRAIIAGQFRPGDHLVEQQLTSSLNVSRHPVREALRLLAREGFVELRRNRGAVVSAVDVGAVIEVYGIRRALGKIALEHLLSGEGKLSPPDLHRVEKLAQRALELAAEKDQEATVSNDLEFQQAIIDATGLPRTIRYFSELTGDVRRFNNLLGVVYTDRLGDARNYVFAIFVALRDGDLEAAGRIWNAKFDKAVERYVSLIHDQTPEGAVRSPPR